MRILLALALGLFLAAAAYAASGTVTQRPRLALSAGSVHGSHFAARERVVVRARAGSQTTTRRISTSASGRFVAQLSSFDPCLGPLLVTARGATGDSASLKLPQRACAPPN